MLFNSGTGERFGENVGNHFASREKMTFNLATLDDFTDPVPLDIDVLHTTMVFRVPEDLEGRLVVDHEARGGLDFHTDLAEKGAEPENLASCRGCRNIFSLSRRICDYSLFLGRPAHCSSTHLDEEA